MASDNDSALARIARTRGAVVEIHWPTKILRITADKNTAEYTADDVETALAKARTKALSLKPWMPQLDEARLAAYRTLVASLPADFVSAQTVTNVVVKDDDTVRY